MADNFIEIPTLVPVNFVQKSRALDASYNFKHFDAWLSDEILLPYQQSSCYYQPWQTSDTFAIQAKIQGLAPLRIKVRNNIGVIVYNQLADFIVAINGVSYYEKSVEMSDLGEGHFRFELHAAAVVLESEIIEVKETWPNTLLAEYSNNFNNDILWETGYAPMFRFDGAIADYLPKSKRTTFIDQPGNVSTIKGVARRVQTLFVGNMYIGVPDYVIDKLTDIFDQNNVTLDGKGYAALEGAEFAPKRFERYGWAQWAMEIGETNNRRAKRYIDDGGGDPPLVERKVVIDYVLEGKLFGPVTGNAADTDYNIQEIS